MPRQNRVTPFGEIVAVPERGTFMGNRGVLHDGEGCILRSYALKRWIVCVLEFRGRKRRVMTPGRYTELFFLDEATALAAGHRPCAECRLARFLDFCNAWGQARPDGGRSARPTAQEIDDRLHSERIAPDHSKRTFKVAQDGLPDGVFVVVPAWGEQAYLARGDELLAWSHGGYRERRRRPKGEKVRLLTPPSTVRAIRAGYVPDLHPSALGFDVKGVVPMLPLHHDPHFTFRFADDRIIHRFHLEGVEAGRPVSVYKIDASTGERLGLLATAAVGEGGWVGFAEPIIVRAGDAFVAVPEAENERP